MASFDAYEILEDRWLADVNSQAMILRHKRTKARVAVLSNADDNKVFFVGFRTPPEDETGVPHIIEHTTLCGSKKYPVKDPFMELAKGSLNTFLNAMTYPDKTLYPLASYNDHDFKNLMDVYLDAVFHPNITKYEEIFKQEGWHYELEDPDSPLTINGVVYNEMKGAYSDPSEVLQSAIHRSLFPDNTYSRDSGGNPVHIPELTYQDYLAFYRRYYHPSNSYIFLYGDMDVAERLEYIDREYLSDYEYLDTKSEIKKQEAFDAAVEFTVDYSVSEEDSTEDATYLAYNRVIGDCLDPMLHCAFDILDYVLATAPGAPVRQALVDAGIGEDVYGQYDGGVLQPVFSVIAKNTNPEEKERFLQIIQRTLEEQVEKGINQEALLAAINSEVFRFREADFGQFPKGLLYSLQCADTWIFDDMSPFVHLECLETYAKLKELIPTGYFEKLVREWLLDNKHGSLVVVKPCAGKNEREEAQLTRKLAEYKASLSDDEISGLIEETQALFTYQQRPSTEEELKTIPMLGRADLKKEAMTFSNKELIMDGVTVLHHDIDTNGIVYCDFIFDAEDFEAEDIPYLGLLYRFHGLLDTADYTYHSLGNVIDIYTGGISENVRVYTDCNDRDRFQLKYEVSVKVLLENLPKACELIREITLSSDFTSIKRLKELTAQFKARIQTRLSSGGETTAICRGMAGFSKYSWCQDKISGIDYYRNLCQVEEMLNTDPEQVIDRFRELVKKIFARNRMLVSFTGTKELFEKAEADIHELLLEFPECSPKGQIPQVELQKKSQGFTDASQIQYVARCGNFADHGYTYSGKLRLLRQILGLDYLWNTVRVKGGAYGVMTNFLRNGDAYFVSYRDPNLTKTIEAYEGITDYIRTFDPDDRDMSKYVIGTFGAIDTPMNPEAKGRRSLRAYLENVTFDMVQRERLEILNAQAEDIRELADLVQSVLDDRVCCVVGNENAVRSAEGIFDSIEKLTR